MVFSKFNLSLKGTQEAERAFAAQQMIANGTIKDRAMSMTGASAGVMKYMAALNITSVSEMTFAQRVRASAIALKEQALAWAASPMGMATIAITGISLLISGINKYNQSIEEHKRKLKEAAQEASKQAEESSNIVSELLKLKTQLDDGTKSADELTSAFEEQLRAMGWTETEIENLITKYSGLAGAINEATREALENARTNAHTDVATSSKSLEAEYDGSPDIVGQDSTIEGLGRGMNGSGNAELDKQIREILNNKGFMFDPGNYWYRAKDDSAASIYEYYQGLQEIVQLMQQTASETNNNAILDSYLYKDVRDAVDQLSESANLYGDAISRLHNADAQLELADYLKTNSIDSKEAFDTYINGIKNSTEYSEEYKLVLIGVANDAFPQFSRATKTATGNTSDMTTAVKDANTTLSTLQGKLDELNSAQEEYNSTGSITAETMQKLIDNNLLQYLDFSSGKLKVNTDALLAEGEAAKVNAIQKLQDAMATDLMNLATGKTEQLSNTAKTAIANLGTQAETTGNQAETAAGKLAGFAIAAQVAKDGAEGNLTGMSVEDFNLQADAIISAYMNAANFIGNITIKSPKTSGGGSSSDKNEALENYLKGAEWQYSAHQDDAKYINDLQWALENLAKTEEEIFDLEQKIEQARKDSATNAINDIEHEIELKKNLYGEDYDATEEYKKIKQIAHAEANRLRGLGFTDESSEIQELQNQWWDAQKKIDDIVTSQYDKQISDIEYARDMLLNNDPDADVTSFYKQLQEAYHARAEYLRSLDPDKYADEIKELELLWWDARKELDNIALDKYEELREAEIKHLEVKYDKEQAIISALEKRYDVQRQIRDKQAEIDAELAASKELPEYLEDNSPLFNDKDYKRLSNELSRIDKSIVGLYDDYRREINDLADDEWYKQEEITAQFERQLEVAMDKYELAEKELELTKKRLEYDNIIKQRDTRIIVAGRQILTADPEKVREAQKALSQTKTEKENLALTQAEDAALHSMQSVSDSTNTLKLSIENIATMLDNLSEGELARFARTLDIDTLDEWLVEVGLADYSAFGSNSSSSARLAPSSTPLTSTAPDAWGSHENQTVRYTGIDENGNLIKEEVSVPEGFDALYEPPRSVIHDKLAARFGETGIQKLLQTVPNYAAMMPKVATPTIPNVQSNNTSNATQYTFMGDIHVNNPVGDPNDLVHALATQTRQIFDVTKNMRR